LILERTAVEEPYHLAVEGLALPDVPRRKMGVLQFDDAVVDGENIGAVLAHADLRSLGRDEELPASMPFAFVFLPGIAFEAGHVSPVPNPDVTAPGDERLATARAGAVPAPCRLDLISLGVFSVNHLRDCGLQIGDRGSPFLSSFFYFPR